MTSIITEADHVIDDCAETLRELARSAEDAGDHALTDDLWAVAANLKAISDLRLKRHRQDG